MASAPAPTIAAPAIAPPTEPSEPARAAPRGPAGPATAVRAMSATTEAIVFAVEPPDPLPSGRLMNSMLSLTASARPAHSARP